MIRLPELSTEWYNDDRLVLTGNTTAGGGNGIKVRECRSKPDQLASMRDGGGGGDDDDEVESD